MLRLAVMSLSYQRAFASGQMDLFSYIALSRSLQLDGVDLHGRHFASLERDYLWRIKQACVERGLSIACLSIPNNFALDAAALPDEMDKTRRLIDAAAFLGAPLVRVFAGWNERQDDDTWRRVVSSLRTTAAYGEDRGVVVALQNHNHHGIAARGSAVLKLIRDVDHPNLKHVMDSGQYVDLYDSMAMTAHLAVHVRCKIYEIETGVERRLDYERIFAILQQANYHGFLSIVYEGTEDERIAVAKSVPFLRGFMNRGHQ